MSIKVKFETTGIYKYFSQSPQVKSVDMLHAVNYDNMNLSQLKSAMDSRKKFDKYVEDSMM